MTTLNNPPKHPSKLKTALKFAASFLTLFLLSVMLANAQDRTITLDEALKLGVESSNRVKLSKAKIDQAMSQYEQAKDAVKPTGKAGLTYDRAEIPANQLDFGSSKINLPTGAN